MSEQKYDGTPVLTRHWYVLFKKDSHNQLPFASDEEAIEAGKKDTEVISVLRAKDSHYIWEKAVTALILGLMLLLSGTAKAQILGGGTNLQGSATVAVATNNYNLSIPAITIAWGNATNAAALVTGNELLGIGPTNANPVFVTNNGYVYVVVATTNYQYSANSGTNGVTQVMPAIQGAGQQLVTGFQAITGTNMINVYAHF